MQILSKIAVAFLYAGVILAANAQEKNPHEAVQNALMSSLQNHDFAKLQAETDKWLRDYENNKITTDEFVERLANLHPARLLQTTPDSDAELWIEKYPTSYAANYLFGAVLSQTASHHTDEYYGKGTKQQQRALFEKYSRLAETQYLKSAKLTTRPYPSYYRLIQVAADLNSKARTDYFTRALAIDPKAYAAHEALLRATAPAHGRNVEEFEAASARAKSSSMRPIDKQKLEALKYDILGDALKLSEPEAASEFYQRAYRTYPTPETLSRLHESAEILRMNGDYDRAIVLYGEVLTVDPTHIQARSMRAHVFAERKRDLNAALPDYLIAVKAGHISSQISLGDIYMYGRITKVDFDRAATYFKMAADQKNPTAVMKLRELEKLRKAAATTANGDSKIKTAADPLRTPAAWIPILKARDFAKLEKMSDQWLRDYASKKISSEQLMKHLFIFYPDGFADPSWQKDVELWVEQYPRSYAASYVLGSIYSRNATEQRGDASARETSRQRLEAYKTNSKRAEQEFIRSLSLYAKPYPSYCGLIKVARSSSQEYYRKAVEIDPNSLKAHAQFLHYRAPKWGGSIGEIDAIVAEVKASRMNKSDKRLLIIQAYEIKADDARINEQSDHAFAMYGEIIAIDKSNTKALIARGQIYEKEKLDLKAALTDYTAAAATGDRWAQNRTGYMYMTGIGVDVNFAMAEKYFRMAEADGDDYALRNLEHLAIARRTASSEPDNGGGISGSNLPEKERK
jgi:TPR repeat protein